MKIRKGDKVIVISGKYKGKKGEVENVYLEDKRVLVEGIHVVTKHIKPTAKTSGGISKINRPIDVSNVMLICPKCNKPTRVGYKIDNGSKYRVCKKCGWWEKRDIHEADLQHLKDAAEAYKYVAEKYHWTIIDSAPDWKLQTIEVIADKIWDEIQKIIKS